MGGHDVTALLRLRSALAGWQLLSNAKGRQFRLSLKAASNEGTPTKPHTIMATNNIPQSNAALTILAERTYNGLNALGTTLTLTITREASQTS